MIAVDTNILVYAHRKDSEWHLPAKRALDPLFSGTRTWAIPWPCLHEFYSVCTHPRIYSPPTPRDALLEMFRQWERQRTIRFLHEGPGYMEKLAQLVDRARIAGPRVHDARIAAICLNHGVSELWSADRHFMDFPPLKLRNPLIDPAD